jgi:hypothetical protein
MSAEAQKLLQAVEHFKARTRGAELPKGTEEAVAGLQKALGQPMPGRDTPGEREALKAAPGTGSALRDAAKGPDAPSPGQREAAGLSEQIEQAVAQITSKAS